MFKPEKIGSLYRTAITSSINILRSSKYMLARHLRLIENFVKGGSRLRMAASSKRMNQGQSYFHSGMRLTDLYDGYHLLLGRDPDPSGLRDYKNLIDGGAPLIEFIMNLLSSPEFRAGPLYKVITNKSLTDDLALVSLDKFQIYVPKNDFQVGKAILAQKSYEPHVTRQIERILEPNMTFVDIGANIGYFSLLASRLVGKGGRVLAFEPGVENCKLIYLNTIKNDFKNIEIFPFAVSDKTGSALYCRIGTNGIIRNIDLSQANDELSGFDIVGTVMLDTALRGMEQVHVIKIDIEGAEYQALKMARSTIKEHFPIIFSEFSPDALQNVSGIAGAEYLKFLTDQGYDISVINATGPIQQCRKNIESVIASFSEKSTSHIDIIAHPKGRL